MATNVHLSEAVRYSLRAQFQKVRSQRGSGAREIDLTPAPEEPPVRMPEYIADTLRKIGALR